jgi:NADP-dependent 3-hydroxy acid dehydrogenase YdfG
MRAESREVAHTVVAVTGAIFGIGAATARLLLEAGAKVTVQAGRRERLDALADEFGADDVLVVTGDAQNPDSATELVTRAVEASAGWTASSSTPASECTAASSTAATPSFR